nr:hypothetical protein Iba_chr05dCG11190 [Ipomoea batatas]
MGLSATRNKTKASMAPSSSFTALSSSSIETRHSSSSSSAATAIMNRLETDPTTFTKQQTSIEGMVNLKDSRNALHDLSLLMVEELPGTMSGSTSRNPTKARTPPVFNSDKYRSNEISPDAVLIRKSNDFDSAYNKRQSYEITKLSAPRRLRASSFFDILVLKTVTFNPKALPNFTAK